MDTAAGQELLSKLGEQGVDLDPVHLSRLEDWFDERIEKHEATREFAAEVKAGAKGETGIPFLFKIFTQMTTAFKVNSTYKDELRRVVRNHFSEFADAFNQLITAAEQACNDKGLGSRVLFLVDGTDRLRGEDADSFFVKDAYQLQLVRALFLYSTPIHLLHGGVALKEGFTATYKLPMIKIATRDGRPNAEGIQAMKDILFRRAPLELFDAEATADYLVEHCGGHPRGLLRLLQYTFEYARNDLFDRPAAERAVRARHLLYNLALLEYNSYWWRSHPVVRTLPAYRETAEA